MKNQQYNQEDYKVRLFKHCTDFDMLLVTDDDPFILKRILKTFLNEKQKNKILKEYNDYVTKHNDQVCRLQRNHKNAKPI